MSSDDGDRSAGSPHERGQARDPTDPGDGQRSATGDGRRGATGDGPRGASVVVRAVASAAGSGSAWTLRSYAVVATLASVFVALIVVLALPGWVLRTAGSPLERIGLGVLVLSGLAVIVPMLLPVLFVQRRRRAGRPQRQRALALAGYAYLASLYLALVASAPPGQRGEPPAALAPLVELLYALPSAAGLAILALGAAVVVAVEYGLDRAARG